MFLKGVGGVAFAAGLLLIIFGVRGEFVARRLASVGVRTTGGVIAIVDAGNDTEAPRIQFSTATGRTVVYTEIPSARGAAGHVGDTVPVFYDPADPETAWRNINEYYLGPAIPGGIGLLLAGFGAIFLFFNPRRPKGIRRAPLQVAQEAPFMVFTETPLPVRLFGQFLGCLMIAAGCLGLGGGVYWAVNNHASIASKLRAVGTIVEFVKPRPAEVAPRIEFATAAGTNISFIGESSGEETNARQVGAYKVGDSVTVLYDESAPEAARAYSFSDVYLGPIWAGAIGIFLVGCGWFFFSVERPRPRARSKTIAAPERSAAAIDGRAPRR